MKILWLSNAPWATSGYGQQTAMFTPRIRDAGHDVAICAFYGLEGGIGGWDGMTIYPTDHTRLGKALLPEYVKDHAVGDPPESVQVITLMDAWTWTDQRFGGIANFEGLRLAAWVPVDHDPVPPKVCQALEAFSARPIAMSRFGEEQLRLAGFDPMYVPHGVDTNVFKPHRETSGMIKEAMKIPADAFVVGMVSNNQGNGPPRKAFPQVFQAFAQFHERHPDSFLYLHSEVLGIMDGINLLALAKLCGVPDNAVGVVDQAKYLTGTIRPQQLAHIYSFMDVLACPSYGEGFGIPIVEAQACGVPVVVTDWTAMPELVGAGWKVQGDRWYDSAHGSFYMCPSVFEIVEAFEAAYEARGDAALKEQAREFALGYDADRVFSKYWLPVLEELERPAATAPVVNGNGNRAQRRKAARAKVPA